MADVQKPVASGSGNALAPLEEVWDHFVPPRWLVEHPQLNARDITPCAVLKPGFVYQTDEMNEGIPQYAVKMVTFPVGSQEADIYELLDRRGLASATHTLPATVLRSKGLPPVIVLPLVSQLRGRYDPRAKLPDMLRHFAQILTGVVNLHRLGIVHLDICIGNMLRAWHPLELEYHQHLELDKIYLIDFGGAKILELGPGHQPAIDLPESQIGKPNPSMERFDPYAWDVYCVGMTFNMLTQVSRKPIPWFLRRYIDWVIGPVCGCKSVCHCRPSARRALFVLTLIRGFVHVSESLKRLMKLIAKLFARPPRAVSP
ncbi:hypothetical protein OH76DRAFT_1362604 [Lentinus brumalis]|uniref:Protein kinase domain-containing protein n=1 Tax=Lentinus brumalis TaxID=2498619 RepID=A0A371CQJ1_9APHY|nr:hypothetical protein OH76DRAFT_1362604 [Polyporus brumalis]